MSISAAQEYVELFEGDHQAKLALLACSAALQLDDQIAEAAIEIVTQTDGSTNGLMQRVKKLGCVWKDWDGSWHITEDVRPHLLDHLDTSVPEQVRGNLRRHLAEAANARAAQLSADGQVTRHAELLFNLEAAYQRVLIPEESESGAAELTQIWQNASGDAARATARSIDYLARELDQTLPSLPDEILFL